jgi:hypothetical protein
VCVHKHYCTELGKTWLLLLVGSNFYSKWYSTVLFDRQRGGPVLGTILFLKLSMTGRWGRQ